MITTESDQKAQNKKNESGILRDPDNAAKILRLTSDTMFMVTKEGICVDIVLNTDRWFLQDTSYFLKKNIFKLIPCETSQALQNNFNKVLATGKTSMDNYEVQVAGKTYFFKCIINLYDDKHLLFQYRDITQRILLKQRIEIVNRKLQDIEKVALIGQWSFNTRTQDFQYTGFTGGLAESSETKTIHLKDYLKNVHPNDHQAVLDYIETNTQKINRDFFDYQYTSNGKNLHFRVRVISTHLNEEEDQIIEGYVQNITDIKEKQHELEMITLAVQNSTDYIFAMGTDGQLVFGNRKFKGYHGWEENDDISKANLFDLVDKGAGQIRWQDIIHQLTKSGQTLNFVLPRPIMERPDILAFDCVSYLVRDSRGADQIWTFGKDITERVQYEKQVKEMNQVMGTILTNIPMVISVKDADNDFRYIFSNRQGNRIHWGIQDDIIGKTDFDLFPRHQAIRMRSDDFKTLQTKEETRKTIYEKDSDGNNVVHDQIRILVEDDSRPLLIAIERDITKDKMMEQELIDAKEKAEESDKLKSAFIANMSHEIRTPLNAIVGFSRIIAETQDPEERKSYYSIVDTNNTRLLGLINEILDLSKIESGIMEFDLESVKLHPLFRDIQQTLTLRCPPGVKLIFDESDPNLVISCDKNRLSQVFNNLIGNATKFTKEGEIRFGYKHRDKIIEFYVKDTGSGITEDKIGKVFDRFIKGDTFTQGTGLGLPICKSIIEKLGGEISVTSTFGEGTCFTFWLPAECIIRNDIQQEPGKNAKGGTIPAKKVILVAEDTDSNYVLLEALIGKIFHLKRAINGMEAVTLFQESQPDLILMDIKMPIMNGFEATKIIRTMSPEIPIIAQSAYAFDQDRNMAMEIGCNDFLAKPFNKAQVLDIISRNI
jgi:signal transduction histidine kinase/CheY-like chemotaxis protein